MGKCKRTKPYKDFQNAAILVGGWAWESPKYFYNADGTRRLKKTGTMVDSGRRETLTCPDAEERELWMKAWGLM